MSESPIKIYLISLFQGNPIFRFWTFLLTLQQMSEWFNGNCLCLSTESVGLFRIISGPLGYRCVSSLTKGIHISRWCMSYHLIDGICSDLFRSILDFWPSLLLYFYIPGLVLHFHALCWCNSHYLAIYWWIILEGLYVFRFPSSLTDLFFCHIYYGSVDDKIITQK